MPEITKSGAKLRLFIVTHKYTDLYFIFFFQQPTPGRQANLGLRLPNRPSAVVFPIGHHSSDCASPSKKTPSSSHCANGAARCTAMGKTAEERFNMLARGWLAYPVMPGCAICAIHHHRRKTAEERFHTLARGWLAYPVTPTHHPSTAEERLYKRHPGMRQRRITHRNPTRTTRQRRAHGASADTISMRFGDALLPPLGAAHPHRKNRHHHRIAANGAMRKNRRRAV